MTDVRLGLLCWNAFQIEHFKNVVAALPAAVCVVLDRGDNLEAIDLAAAERVFARVLVIKTRDILRLENDFDVLLFQSHFPRMEELTRIRLVSLQYGLAKERHNYGAWRAFADLNLMYGPYAAGRASHFSPSLSVGNPAFAGWLPQAARERRQEYEARMNLAAGRPTILYMPTWGQLGSFDHLAPAIAQLTSRFNVILKIHHHDATAFDWRRKASQLGLQHLYDAEGDPKRLLAVSDVVVSDFSGAIFDAVFAEIPVVLYQAHLRGSLTHSGEQSIEQRERDRIGLVCPDLLRIGDTVEKALDRASDVIARAAPLRAELFAHDTPTLVLPRIAKAVDDLVRGNLPELSAEQSAVREVVREHRRLDRRNGWLRKLRKWRERTAARLSQRPA